MGISQHISSTIWLHHSNCNSWPRSPLIQEYPSLPPPVKYTLVDQQSRINWRGTRGENHQVMRSGVHRFTETINQVVELRFAGWMKGLFFFTRSTRNAAAMRRVVDVVDKSQLYGGVWGPNDPERNWQRVGTQRSSPQEIRGFKSYQIWHRMSFYVWMMTSNAGSRR